MKLNQLLADVAVIRTNVDMETQIQKLRPRLNVALLKQLRVAPSWWNT